MYRDTLQGKLFHEKRSLVFFLIRLLVLYSKAQFFSEWWVLYREAIKCFRICGGGTPQWSKIGKKIVAFMITSRAKINVFLNKLFLSFHKPRRWYCQESLNQKYLVNADFRALCIGWWWKVQVLNATDINQEVLTPKGIHLRASITFPNTN